MIFDAETREVLDLVRDFVDNEIIPKVGDIEKNDNEGLDELLDKAVGMGLNALCGPAEFGGPGFTNVQVFAIAEEIARGDIGVGTTLIGNCLASYPVILSGTKEQQEYWFKTMLEKFDIVKTWDIPNLI